MSTFGAKGKRKAPPNHGCIEIASFQTSGVGGIGRIQAVYETYC